MDFGEKSCLGYPYQCEYVQYVPCISSWLSIANQVLLVMIILFLKYYSVRTHGQVKEATAPKDHGVHTEPSPTEMLASQPVG
jgi:hypothetical protein